MNENLAIVGSNALVLDSPEDTLTQEASLIEKQASSVAVTNDAEYAAAGDLTKAVKKMQKKVKDYWEPMRVNAKAAYDEVLAHKKEMLDPLEAAEKILKGKMGDYSMEKERKRRAQEEAMRKLAEQEMNRKLEEAARAETAGDTAGAEFAMVEAEVMEGVSISGSIQAQMVVGKGAYLRRAYEHPDYLCKEDGIVVLRNGEVIQKEGCCLYPGEQLIGGWCRVHFNRNGQERTAFKEVSFSEYDKGQANWKSKPATMICKVATSQCVREAFPKDYEGLYSEEEMIASGAIPASYTVVPETGEVITPDEEPDPPISQEQRQSLFRMAKEHLGGDANKILKEMVEQHGYESTNGMPVSVYNQVVSEIMRLAEEKRAEQASPEPVSEDGGSQEEPAE